MEMEKQKCTSSKLPNYSSHSHILSMHKSSQTISKSKPKIRIIHIFAPEIIKTDAANFRELVQRLTGKPPDGDGNKKKRMRDAERIKGEEEIWNAGDGFLGGFGDLLDYGFGNNHFPFLEGTTQIDGFGDQTVQFAEAN